MITTKAIFEAAQTAFAEHNPKFPFPKKHPLEEQTSEFKRAFLAFSADINAVHEREMSALAVKCNEEKSDLLRKVGKWRDEACNYSDQVYSIKKECRKAYRYAAIAWLLFSLVSTVAAVLLFFAYQSCVPQFQADQFPFKITDSVVTYDVFGNTELKPICKLI